MTAPVNRRPQRKPSTAAKPTCCPACHGSGQVSATVSVGRGSRRRNVGKQEGMCIACFGTGEPSGDGGAA